MLNPNDLANQPSRSAASAEENEQGEFVDLREIFRRLIRGSGQIVGLALLGLTISALIYLTGSRSSLVSTSGRIVFDFPGFGKGQYPDGSKFRPDDLNAPDIVASALQSQGLSATSDFQSAIRAGLSVEGIIPADIVKVHDRQRAAGQVPSPFFPDEFSITLTLPRNFPLDNRQRGMLLNAIIGAFQDKFSATYVKVPASFGTAISSLKTADLSEYEQILLPDIENLQSYLNQQLDQAKDFRSQTTGFSFSDLLDQTQIFSQIRVNELLGLIRQNGLSRDRSLAITKIQYYLQTLEDHEESAIEDEKVVLGLLADARQHAANYVVGIKSQATRPEGPILDQGLVDSLLANDSYNFLVRKELNAGLNVKHIQAEKARMLERLKYLEAFNSNTHADNAAIMAQVEKSLTDLESAYTTLITNIRNTQVDFANQEFAGAIRLSDNIRTSGTMRPLAMACAVGLFLGLSAGLGLSLLGVYIGPRRG